MVSQYKHESKGEIKAIKRFNDSILEKQLDPCKCKWAYFSEEGGYMALCFDTGPSSCVSIRASTPVLARWAPEGAPPNESVPVLAGLITPDGPVCEGPPLSTMVGWGEGTDAFWVGSDDAERVGRVSEAGWDVDKDLASTSKLRPCCTQCPYLESWVRQKKRQKPKLIFRLKLQVDTSRYIY